MTVSRFASEEEIFEEEFSAINKELIHINKEYNLKDHTDLNKERFDWADKIQDSPIFYGARMWEFPFAILNADLQPGLKCADVGCGTTPFTIYLANKVGAQNVTGFDPDYIANENEERHSAFGIKKSHLDKIGINFQPDNLLKMNVPDESFDRVFCISVLEHIPSFVTQQQGIQEMVRILKPGGKLILTVDLGLQNTLTVPLDLIKFSGLIPVNGIDLKWQTKRFANYGNSGMDVFGLVLEKVTDKIFAK